MENPYTLVFGKTPANYIDRDSEIPEIISTLKEREPSIRTYIITGVRGSGKTVALSYIENTFRPLKDYVVLSLNSEQDMLAGCAEELAASSRKHSFFNNIDISISVPGLTVSKASSGSGSPSIIVDTILKELTAHNKRVVFCIDEVRSTKNIKTFCQAFNIWLRKDYDVFLIITGLKNNILRLQGDNSISFLKRAEKIELQALSTKAIMRNYQESLGISEEKAAEMALITKGYSYAFQLLGYLCFKNSCDYMDVMQQFEDKLSDNVYDLIWRDFSKREKEVVSAIINSETKSSGDIAQIGNFTPNTYNQYRNILINKGIIKCDGHGMVDFTLPHFGEIAKRNIELLLWLS